MQVPTDTQEPYLHHEMQRFGPAVLPGQRSLPASAATAPRRIPPPARTAAVIVQTKAYYSAHSGNQSTYKVVVTGLETPAGAGEYGDAGDVDIATIAYPSIDVIENDYSGASSYTKTYTLENPPSWWVGLLEVSADGGFDSNFNDQTATVKIYTKPAGAPDVYYSLEKSGSGNTVDLTINY
jgi:hypothetical protein